MNTDASHKVRRLIAALSIFAVVWAVLPTSALQGNAQAPKTSGKKMMNAPAIPQDHPLRVSAQEFTRAFNAGDAKAIGSLLTSDCDYADEAGNIYHGRDEIQSEYANFFRQNPGAKIEIHIDSLRMPNGSAAIEDGKATVQLANGPVSTSQYRVVHIKQDGRWLMTSIRDSANETPSHYDNLRDLDWLIGHWVARGEGREVQTTFRWLGNKNFIQRIFTVKNADGATTTGTQIIGWDPTDRQVVSWTFDSTGGYGQGRWQPVENGWSITSTGTMPDGSPLLSTEITTKKDDNHFTWRSVNRSVQGIPLPDTGRIVVERVRENK